MSKKEVLVQALCARYPLLRREMIAEGVDKLIGILKSGENVDFNGEPLRLSATPVEYFLKALDFNHAGRKNYEYLFGDRDLVERVLRAEQCMEAKHDPSRNEYQRKYQKNRYHERKKQAIEMLGGKCVTCGSTENLELDHKDPSNKNFTITKLWSVPEAEFKREVKKCRLLCRKHHLKNTGKQRENGEVKSEPGKSQYGKDNRKKASSRLEILAKNLAFRDVARAGAHIAKQVASSHKEGGVQALLASAFHKHQRMESPIVTWSVFDRQGDGHQLLFRVYGREKDADVVQSVVDSVKEALAPAGADLEYEDDLSEPGLLVKTISGICH